MDTWSQIRAPIFRRTKSAPPQSVRGRVQTSKICITKSFFMIQNTFPEAQQKNRCTPRRARRARDHSSKPPISEPGFLSGWRPARSGWGTPILDPNCQMSCKFTKLYAYIEIGQNYDPQGPKIRPRRSSFFTGKSVTMCPLTLAGHFSAGIST